MSRAQIIDRDPGLFYRDLRDVGFFFKDFIYLYERERMSRGWGRGRERESQVDSPLSREPDVGLNPRTLRS